MSTRILVVGILRGTRTGGRLHSQKYRLQIKKWLEKYLPGVEVHAPIEKARDMHDYGLVKGIEAFFDTVRRASQYDASVIYVPEASMGSAIMIWEAYRNQRPVVVISPLENRTVRALSTAICKDMKAFHAFVRGGQFGALLAKTGAAVSAT
jgi:hypothetical protein